MAVNALSDRGSLWISGPKEIGLEEFMLLPRITASWMNAWGLAEVC